MRVIRILNTLCEIVFWYHGTSEADFPLKGRIGKAQIETCWVEPYEFSITDSSHRGFLSTVPIAERSFVMSTLIHSIKSCATSIELGNHWMALTPNLPYLDFGSELYLNQNIARCKVVCVPVRYKPGPSRNSDQNLRQQWYTSKIDSKRGQSREKKCLCQETRTRLSKSTGWLHISAQ